MSNLGWYQKMTTAAKKVGGPKNLFLIVLGTGAILDASAKYCYKIISKSRDNKKQLAEATIIHTVKKEAKSNEGLVFLVGDQFRVLERDGDAVLIEKLDDNNNPYFVSAKFLSKISDYQSKE